jgi:hypothetical protein
VWNESEVDKVRQRAAVLFAQGIASDELVQNSGELEAPVPVSDPGGRLHSWFIGVTVNSKLAGFLQLLPDLTLLRYSTFQRQPTTLEGSPDSADWLDRGRIRRRAANALRAGESLGEPYLTFDQHPSRLVWAVPVASERGGKKEIFVAGEFVYEPTADDSPAGLGGGHIG